MKKKNRNSFWMMAIAIASLAMPLTACSSDDNEMAKLDPVESSKLYAVALDRTRQEE